MGEGFVRFKRKYLIDAIVKASLVFLSVLLLVVGAFLIVISQGKSDFNIIYAVLIAIGSGLLLGLAAFFLFRLSDRRLAKRLDKELGLKEKIQTMHAFREDEGELKLLQREDAQAILKDAPLKFTSLLKGWIVFIVILVLSFAVFLTSLIMWASMEDVPPDEPTSPVIPDKEPEEEFEATDHHKIALEALIKEVEASNLQADAKEAVIAELTLLLANLDSLKLENQMKDYVIRVIKNVRGIVNTVNSTFAFHMYARNSENELLQKLSLALYSLDLERIETDIAAIRAEIFVDNSRTEIESFKDELVALMNNSGVSQDDKLYIAIKSLSDSLTDIIDHPTYSETGVNRILDTAFNINLLNNIKSLVPQQKTNESVKVRVVEELMRIFGITEEDLEEKKDEEGSLETEEPEERPERGDDGGFGTGETVFGSNDIVIDPEINPQSSIDELNVQYGTIIGRYDAKINEMLQNGEISEELAEILRKYFTLLTTPSEN